ncbi:hypothetical protein Tco_1460872, partial [Tanacetum coccineum]
MRIGSLAVRVVEVVPASILSQRIISSLCCLFPLIQSFITSSDTTCSTSNTNQVWQNQEYNKSKSDKGYHAVPPPYTGNFIPFKPDLTFMYEIVESENMDVTTIVTPSNVKKVESNHEFADVKNNGDAVEPKAVRKNRFRPPVIEDWNFDDDSEVEFIPNVEDKTVRPSTKKIKFVKSARETVKKVETPKQNKHYPRGNQSNWNNLISQKLGSDFKMFNKACFVCGSFEHLHYVCDKKEYNKSKSDKGYHTVPPPYTGNFIPFKPDITFMDEIVESDAVEPKTVRKNSFSAPIIEDWNSDDDSEVELIPNDKTVRPSTEKIKFVKFARETAEKEVTPKQNKHSPRGNQRNWNNFMSQKLESDFKMINKACFVCGSFEHLHYVCDKKLKRPVWNNSSRVNHKNFANKMTNPHPNRRFVPQAVLIKSGKINTVGASVNTAVRHVNFAGSKTTVNHPRPITNTYKKGYSQDTGPFNTNKNSIFNKKVNTVRVKDTTARYRAVVSENKGKRANVVKASACWSNPHQKEYKKKGVIDSGCSRHMTGNKCYLTEYEDYDGGFVSFGD